MSQNTLLAKVIAKPTTTAVTLSFQVPLELSDKLNAVADRIKQPKYHVLKILMDQGIDDLNAAIDVDEAGHPPPADVLPAATGITGAQDTNTPDEPAGTPDEPADTSDIDEVRNAFAN